MITDAHLKMELKFHNSVILSNFELKSLKVDQVIFFSTQIGIPNMKALAKILFEISCTRFSNFASKGT